MASISPRFAGKPPEERFQEEEVEHGTLHTALPQAPVEPNARRWAGRSDDAHQRPAAEGVEEPDELLRDPHVAQEKRQRPMRRCVKCLGYVEGQDVILLLLTLQPGTPGQPPWSLAWPRIASPQQTPCVPGRP